MSYLYYCNNYDALLELQHLKHFCYLLLRWDWSTWSCRCRNRSSSKRFSSNREATSSWAVARHDRRI